MASMTATEARQIARDIVASLQNCQWDLSTIERLLPRGWYLADCEDSDFHPLTVTTVTTALRKFAHYESPTYLTFQQNKRHQ